MALRHWHRHHRGEGRQDDGPVSTVTILPAVNKRSMAPDPSSASAAEDMEHARELARRYLPDLVRLHAGIALGSNSEALLHTRMLSAKEIRELAGGGIPQTAPAPPTPQDDVSNGEPS